MKTPAHTATLSHRLHAAARAWRRMSILDHIALVAGPLLAAALLGVLVQACEASVQRGQQLRAEQSDTAAR